MASSVTLLNVDVLTGLTGTYGKQAPISPLGLELKNALKVYHFELGTGASVGNTHFCNFIYEFSQTISGATSLNFFNGTQFDILRQAIAMTKMKFIRISHESPSGGNLTLTGNMITGSTFGTQASRTLLPGEFWGDCNPNDGWTITNTVNETLTLTPAIGSIAVSILILGIT